MRKREKTEHYKQKSLKKFRVLVLTALFSTLTLFLSVSTFDQEILENAQILDLNSASVHSKIYIHGNTALNNFCAGNGTTATIRKIFHLERRKI